MGERRSALPARGRVSAGDCRPPAVRNIKNTEPTLNPASLSAFLRSLQQKVPAGVFNPWTDIDPATDRATNAPMDRLARLRAHLATEASFVLLGEAAGYQGCKVSGIPFTSERLLLEGTIPRISAPPARLTSRTRPWSEPSATTVWKTLHELGIASHTVLWNAYPWHPHKPGTLHSNRTPSRAERQSGVSVVQGLLRLFPEAQVFAVGRNAESSLAELGITATALRHPSMGGAAMFSKQLQDAVRRGSAR
jgi:uracil-DNA glycosylase